MFRRRPPEDAPERDLLARADAWLRASPGRALTGDAVRAIAQQEGIDFATALCYQAVCRDPRQETFLRTLAALPETMTPDCRLDATVAVVPGAFYREYPHTGADGRLLREVAAEFACPTELIPLPSFRSPRAAARLIVDWLARRPNGERIVLVSLSKGGGEVKLALAEPDAEHAFRNVNTWVNLCGLLHGTPLANWAVARRLRALWFRLVLWMQGHDFTIVHELARGPGTPLDGALRLPAHLQLISVVGFPLRRHLTNGLARRCHRRLSPLGPNDGAGVLLSDVAEMPGLVYPFWGADHYLKPANINVHGLVVRILHYLCRAQEPAHVEQGANEPA